MDHAKMKILLVVATKRGGNPLRLKSKVFPATSIGRELVDPNFILNRVGGKGNLLIFRYHRHTRGNTSLFADAFGHADAS